MKLHVHATALLRIARGIARGPLAPRALALLAASVPVLAQAPAPARYVGAHAGGARLLNVPSQDGVTIATLAAGTPLAVHGERAGFLEVEPPGGMGVWIYGEYARETELPGVIEITGNNLTMRPLASSSNQSFPLKQKLFRGDRVRLIERAAPDKPFATDWLRVWTPPGTFAYVAATETTPLPAGQDAGAQWRAANDAALAARPALPAPSTAQPASAAKPKAKPAAASTGAGTAAAAGAGSNGSAAGNATGNAAGSAMGAAASQAREALAQADLAFEAAKRGEGDLQTARDGYERVLALAPADASEARSARARLEEIGAREELARLQQDYNRYEQEAREEAAAAESELESIRLKKDPLWGGRFQARGWIERVRRQGGEEALVVRWAGAETAELLCTSGRYDLSLYENFEVGVIGVTARGSIAKDIGQHARPLQLDVARLEVLSGRRARR